MEKQKLNVHFSANLIDKKIVEFLSLKFEITILNITTEQIKNPKVNLNDILKTVDLIIFTGGEDVHPKFYDQNIGKFTHVNEKRDDLEFSILHCSLISSSVINKIPKLGICRGAQLLTVYNGGRLIQHVTGHNNNDQIIEYYSGSSMISTIQVSSDHHQMMFPFDLKKDQYELIGWSKNFQSNTYLDGQNKETTLPVNFVEPEIVYYKYRNSLCIQSHPEWCIGTKGSDTCLNLIQKYLFKNKVKEEISSDNPYLDEPYLHEPIASFNSNSPFNSLPNFYDKIQNLQEEVYNLQDKKKYQSSFKKEVRVKGGIASYWDSEEIKELSKILIQPMNTTIIK